MLRAVIPLVLVASIASAGDAEGPKAAIASRGIVLKAGKRHLLVVVPVAKKQELDDPSSRFHRAKYYFGDTKTLFEVPAGSWRIDGSTAETIELADPRELLAAKLRRDGETFSLQCADWHEHAASRRTFALTVADAKTQTLAAKAPLKPLFMPYRAFVLMRAPNTTQYYYVDRNIEPDSQDFRLFIGKRGAMKKVPVKEVALDTSSLILVTAKGTLAVTLPTQKDTLPTVTFGLAKKTQTLDVIPTYTNRKLIYSELGVYTRDRTGFPCDEL